VKPAHDSEKWRNTPEKHSGSGKNGKSSVRFEMIPALNTPFSTPNLQKIRRQFLFPQ